MIRRDFTKSNKEFFAKSKFWLIGIGVFLLIGILCAAIFGMNCNFEMKGYNEFTVSITQEDRSKFAQFSGEISNVINSHNGKYDSTVIFGEGDNTKLVVRYSKTLKTSVQEEINDEIADALEIEVESISTHSHVNPAVRAKDYVYTACAILLVVMVAVIFAAIRYNRASALAILLSCLLGSAGFMSITAILRLSVGLSYFAMLVALNLLFIYFACDLFENMRENNWLAHGEYGKALETSIKSSKNRILAICISVMLLGLLFVIFAPTALKLVSINIMFMAVVSLAVGLFVVPYVWSVFITMFKNKEYTVKAEKIEE